MQQNIALANHSGIEQNSPVIIQDVVVLGAYLPTSQPTGEFNSFADVSTQQERLNSCITSIISIASTIHKSLNCDDANNLAPDKKNCITRLVTNEFSFYTNKPLKIEEFNNLAQNIVTHASTQPENLHLVLSSFAVLTSEEGIMNVVFYVECGKDPQIKLIAKNNPSIIDPVYYDNSSNLHYYPNVGVSHQQTRANEIKINDKTYPLSFDNVFVSKTAGNEKFILCIDICLDHYNGVAKKSFTEKLEGLVKNPFHDQENDAPLPQYCSHIVTSNSIALCDTNLLGRVSHADPHPLCTKKKFEETKVPKLNEEIDLKAFTFSLGNQLTPEIWLPGPEKCAPLPNREMNLVNAYNILLGSINADTYRTALQMAIENKNVTLAYNLISKIISPEKIDAASLNLSIKDENLIHYQQLLEPNSSLSEWIKSQSDFLIKAASQGDIPMATFLLKQGASVEQTNIMGRTPLFEAIEKKDIEMIKYLLNQGANIYHNDTTNLSPLSLAISKDFEIFQLLVNFQNERDKLSKLLEEVLLRPQPLVKQYEIEKEPVNSQSTTPDPSETPPIKPKSSPKQP